MGLLHTEDIESHIFPTFPRSIIRRVGSKKFVQQGRSYFCARSVWIIREHGNMARTPLTAFFNRPNINLRPSLRFFRIEAGYEGFEKVARSPSSLLLVLQKASMKIWLGEVKCLISWLACSSSSGKGKWGKRYFHIQSIF